ncbi:hypothetical protein DPMN_171634 [Dreissena polymorpha]|uniref:Uncharacterized protein n=1 Tax=Dreissena polymorpha TaxID=45954 RepID=A0A9D4DYC8_DREPO|nr:hypothetical protein DPMN_171634 [Dreissena polymorpha]
MLTQLRGLSTKQSDTLEPYIQDKRSGTIRPKEQHTFYWLHQRFDETNDADDATTNININPRSRKMKIQNKKHTLIYSHRQIRQSTSAKQDKHQKSKGSTQTSNK